MLWHVLPKHHCFWHLCYRCRFLHPRNGNCCSDEDYVGKIKNVVVLSAPGVPYRYANTLVHCGFFNGENLNLEIGLSPVLFSRVKTCISKSGRVLFCFQGENLYLKIGHICCHCYHLLPALCCCRYYYSCHPSPITSGCGAVPGDRPYHRPRRVPR